MLETSTVEAMHTTTNRQSRQVDRLATTPDPLVAIIIPVYKQPGYLADAVISTMKQSMRQRIKTVIVNDGCPYASTDELGRLFSTNFPGDVFYLKKDNGGLSSARNTGIRFALDAWPSIQAILPLDADNSLAPHTIERLWQSLTESAADTGWVYQDLTNFGTEDTSWRTGIPFSAYRLIHENFCDAGALIHRRVFDSGIWYDEQMKSGYEDWELYIRASLDGLRGVHAAETGFLYRVRGHSMLTDTQQRHRDVYQTIVQKHARQLRPHRLTELEHDELPRFAIVELDADRVRWTTNPLDTDQSTMSIAAYLDAIVEWEGERRPKERYVPPITVLSTEAVIRRLQHMRLLPGVLLGMQSLAARHDNVFLNIRGAESPYFVGLSRADGRHQPPLIALPTRRLIEVASQRTNRLSNLVRGTDGFNQAGLTLQVGMAHIVHSGGLRDGQESNRRDADVIDSAIAVLGDLSARMKTSSSAAARQRALGENDTFVASNTYFAARQQLDKGSASFPYFTRERTGSRRVQVWFTAPWIRLGGVDQIVLNLAQQLAAHDLTCDVHLLVTDANEVEANPRSLDAFKTVTFLSAGEERDEQRLLDILSGADIIFNAHSRATYNALPRLKSAVSAPVVSLLQVIDPDPFGVPRGYPVLSSRQYEPLIGTFIVPSRRLKRTCINLGVPDEKVIVVPNAPVVHPPTLDAALAMAQEKARRRFSSERPIRILFAGRFDEQKGFDRLGPIYEALTGLGVPFSFTVIGKAVLSRANPAEQMPGAAFLPPANDPETLARYYAENDVFLLPSRWEGVPLSMLEAMSFGCVVVATNVGAIDEVLEDGTNGFLIDPDLPEEEIAAAISSRIAGIGTNTSACSELREEGVRRAMSFTWRDAAAHLTPLIEVTKGMDAK